VGHWPSIKAVKVYRALLRLGWSLKRQPGTSHKTLERPGWPDHTWPWDDGDEIGPVMLSRIAKRTGLKREDL
jgi:predicted RNA binding protein YcfA (HicA-like mRNA interferase family)